MFIVDAPPGAVRFPAGLFLVIHGFGWPQHRLFAYHLLSPLDDFFRIFVPSIIANLSNLLAYNYL